MGERAHTPGRDRPILFSAPMVRALLDGRKTQTRRLIKPQPIVHPAGNWSWEGRNGGFVGAAGTHVDEGFPESARFWMCIQTGDRLWVREAWRTGKAYDDLKPSELGGEEPIQYSADSHIEKWGHRLTTAAGKLRPSMFMPRWASRLTLTVTDVRVQRLRNISTDDAEAEGCPPCDRCGDCGWINSGPDGGWQCTEPGCGDAYVDQYARLWDSINGVGSWAANPWVAAYTFTVAHQNIDAPTSEGSSHV